jgi:hypothetical protein
MARDWVKLHTSMLFHADTQELTGEHFKLWVNLLLLAGTLDDGGVIGPPPNVAFALRLTPDELATGLDALNGRVVTTDDGQLCVRDWHEWQPLSERDRKRELRARASHVVPACPTVSHDVPAGPKSPYIRRDETRQEQPRAAARWAPVEEAIAQSYGGAETRTRTGAVKADVGRLLKLLGEHSGSEPVEAVRLWRLWWASVDGRYRPTMRNAGEKLGAWLAERKAEPRTWTLVKEVDDGA